jgi:hypothetical protein
MMKSAFDSEKEYELTELGRQFVSYAMNEMVTRIAATASSSGSAPDAEPSADPSVPNPLP